ncbi:hypothetical protein BU25DRAFT_134426 [Macroventuria anomochaeta]|uniref:Uncharacterized protein n=1 Tax=Macroventuria anomochaeta TaxID=301207 RepID=A0ACB6RS27_9PLEO|nr:uncharacterized protein BU25DRAFT_134426 [Macroventuria anomochaeta]KAF2624785.1 hypothetical protein BU25DRAFT_134426 [Macroventuria anomochaeta]
MPDVIQRNIGPLSNRLTARKRKRNTLQIPEFLYLAPVGFAFGATSSFVTFNGR